MAAFSVLGIRDGFKRLMAGDASCAVPLSIDDVSRIHFTGGSYLGISRANPTRDVRSLEQVTRVLHELRVDTLITIGGDDTAYSAMRLADHAGGRLKVVHVPKTIDNDLDLPYGISTFGFQTARHVGVELVKNLMTDAKTTARWYLIVAMGRKAGHLALGIGKAAGPRSRSSPRSSRASARSASTTSPTSFWRRSSSARPWAATTARRCWPKASSSSWRPRTCGRSATCSATSTTTCGWPRSTSATWSRPTCAPSIKELGIDAALVTKDIGYELRCADPIPFDMEYTRDLGYCAAQYLLDGGSHAMVTLVDGRFEPMPFSEMLDPETGRTRVRLVDTSSEQYKIARRYMVRLSRQDLEDDVLVEAMAHVAKISAKEFRGRFSYAVDAEAGRRVLEAAFVGDAEWRLSA